MVHFFGTTLVPYRPTDHTERKRAAARDRITAAALELVAEGGWRVAQVKEVSARAGVATGSVYRHFPGKAELLAEVFRIGSQREVDAVAAADGLEDAVRTFARRALAGRRLAYALIAEPADPAVEAERLVFRRAYAAIFAERVGGHPVVAAALVGALAEALVGPLSADHAIDEDGLVELLVALSLNLESLHVPA